MERTVSVPPNRRAYWGVVEDCLVEIHGLSRRDARQKISELLKDLASPPPGIETEIFYHSEQFQVACDLAGRQLDQKQFAEAYKRIQIRHYAAVRPRPAAEVVAGT